MKNNILTPSLRCDRRVSPSPSNLACRQAGMERGIKGMRCILFLICIFYFSTAFASTIKSNELIENASSYNGKVIEFQGEAIGDIMARGNYAWINVNDGSRAIGIWVKKGLTDKITYTGSYRFTGDTIKITGTFHRACPQHGGDLDIHANEIIVTEKGYTRPSPVAWPKIFMAFFLLIGIIALLLYPKINS